MALTFGSELSFKICKSVFANGDRFNTKNCLAIPSRNHDEPRNTAELAESSFEEVCTKHLRTRTITLSCNP